MVIGNFCNFFISKGSCGELRSQIYRALDRSYITQIEFDEIFLLAKEIIVLLQKLINYLEQSEIKGLKYRTRQNKETTVNGKLN